MSNEIHQHFKERFIVRMNMKTQFYENDSILNWMQKQREQGTFV